jgi:phosphate transport system substrate-binding protein
MVKKVPANNELHIVNPPKKFTLAYPISTFTYAIVPHGSSKKGELEQFINYAITTGAKYGPALDFAPLPKIVLSAAKRAVSGI